MTTLRVIVDHLVQVHPGGIGRYSEELTKQLVETAPDDCVVDALVSLVPPEEVDAVKLRLPGAQVTRLPLARRELALAFRTGLFVPNMDGMVHSPSLLAPLRKHDRVTYGDQVTATIHDTLPWTHPDSLGKARVSWTKSMAKRAQKHADAVIVPTHAVADELSRFLDFGDRIRVIAGAPATTLQLPVDANERAMRLGLPDRFILTMGSIEPRKGVRALIQAMADPAIGSLPLLIAGPDRWADESAGGIAAAAGLPEGRVRALGFLSDADLAVLFDRAEVFVYPSLAEGFGLPLVEAFRFGTPVIHSDDPALVEVSGGAGIAVPRVPTDTYSMRLAEAIGHVLSDGRTSTRLRVQSSDRGRAFSWRDSAERIWQLHADL
jgi:glycosyltransferase involved in cell wall biosynthesis